MGEAEQKKGREGALRAKHWLESTTRVRATHVNPDGIAEKKLSFRKVHYETEQSVFSFDLGGEFREGEFNGHQFMAECKNHDTGSNLAGHYKDFLAHCYRVVSMDYPMADQLMWIAYAPHTGTSWDKLTTAEYVRHAVLTPRLHGVNFLPEQDPESEFSEKVAEEVSKRLWVIILSHKQIDHLTISDEYRGYLEGYIVAKGIGGKL